MQDFSLFLSNHLVLTYALAIGLLLLALIEFLRNKQMTYHIDTKAAVQLINRQHAVVIDIRSPEQFNANHLIDAESIPADDLSKSSQKLARFKSKPVIFVCGQGVQSQKIAAKMLKDGYQAFSLSGGMRAWQASGLPLSRGSK